MEEIPLDAATIDLCEKVLLALIGALFGGVVKTLIDQYGMHQLLPDLLEQLKSSVKLCKQAYSPAEAKVVGSLCDSARADLVTLVRLGARRRRQLLEGVRLLRTISMQAGLVDPSRDNDLLSDALKTLRASGEQMELWLAKSGRKIRSGG